MIRKLKKGFTLVELVVVIAVVAILATVSVVSYIGITKKAQQSNDQMLVDQVNRSLESSEILKGKRSTVFEAVSALEEDGFKIDNLKEESKDYRFAYSLKKNKFVIVEKDANVVYPKDDSLLGPKSTDLWVFCSSTSGLPSGYSYYLKGENLSGDVSVAGGLDVGKNTGINNVSYSASAAHDAIFRLNGGKLVVNNTTDDADQLFYGYADSVEVTTGSHCFTAHGTIGTMDLKQGKAVADEGGYVGLVKAAAGTVAEEDNGGVFVIPSNAVASEISSTVASNIGYTISGTTITPSAEKAEIAEKASADFAEEAKEDESCIAIVGSKKYDSFKLAVEEAAQGDIIYLCNSFTLTEDIGDFGGDSVENVYIIGGLKNEVKLLKDVQITFDKVGGVNFYLQQGGKLNPNGYKLKLTSSVEVFISYTQSNVEFTEEGSSAIFTKSLVYTAPTNSLPTAFTYSSANNRWEWGTKSFFFAGGASAVNGPGTNPEIPIGW